MNNIKDSLDNIILNKKIKTVFQPIISLKSGYVLGYEALSRITCPSEFDNPEALFSSAKELDRLPELEKLCRTKALEAYQKSAELLNYKKLFLNVSPNIFGDVKFKEEFDKDFLARYGILSDNTVIEITERNIIPDISRLKNSVSNYKCQDFKIAIDDAGAGYSGLNLITDIHPHYIKLDMKLIRNINSDKIKRNLVKSMVEFSKVSNNMIIAEGIETYQELKTVMKLGVQYGQGYFIQKPDERIQNIAQNVLHVIQTESKKTTESIQSNIYNSAVKDLCTTTKTISPDEPTLNVYEFIKKDSLCAGMCIVDNDKPIGIITKENLSFVLSGQYGFTLYQKKPISTIMDREFLTTEADTPIEVIASLAMERPNDKIYDFIVVTHNNRYFGTVTVKDLLQQLLELQVLNAKQLNPLTGLPGNLNIENRLKQCIKGNSKFSVSYIDIDNFKPYNDIYGFERGDLIIKMLADILRTHIPSDQFIGHIGGDDFIVILDWHITENYYSKIIEKFEENASSFYSQNDIENGYITATSRRGLLERIPLISLTTVTITNESKTFNSTLELSSMLSGLKTRAKYLKANRIQDNIIY